MADMGFGLTTEDIRSIAFKIAEKSHRKHHFSNEMAGQGWFEGLKSRHPQLCI